jgi:hypothetical protein
LLNNKTDINSGLLKNCCDINNNTKINLFANPEKTSTGLLVSFINNNTYLIRNNGNNKFVLFGCPFLIKSPTGLFGSSTDKYSSSCFFANTEKTSSGLFGSSINKNNSEWFGTK